MLEYDPNGVFMNNFGRRLVGIGTKQDSDPAANRCALLDFCFCSQNRDCGPTQFCGTVPGYPDKPVCRTKNDHKVIDQVVMYKFPKYYIQWMLQNIPTLFAKAKFKCAISAISQLSQSLV
jgi:hypothetical protein